MKNAQIFIISIIIVISISLSARSQESQTPVKKCMHFGANIADINILEQSGAIDTFEVTAATLTATKETGSNIARIMLFYDSWILNNTASIARIDKLIKKIKESGLKLMLANQATPSFERKRISWEEYKEIELKYVRLFAERYTPDYYIITIEPYLSVAEKNLRKHPSVDEFVMQTKRLADTVKEVSPTTKTGIAILAGDGREEAFYKKVLSMPNLDIIGLNVYPYVKGVAFRTLGHTKRLIKENPHSYGKELWILETWNDVYSSFRKVGDPKNKKRDATWLKTIVAFAENHNFDGLVIYYGQHFITYDTGWYGKKIDASNRTPAFFAFKEIVNKRRQK